MGLNIGLNIVPFNLELIVDLNNLTYVDEISKASDQIADIVKSRVEEEYPTKVKWHPSMTISGWYGDAMRGPALYGWTHVDHFTKIFGRVKRGFYLLFPPIPIPGLRLKWYAADNLIVPKSLQDVVKGVYLARSAEGGWRTRDIYVPPGIKKEI